MAALCCACNKRSATLARSLDIGTRRSSRTPMGVTTADSALTCAVCMALLRFVSINATTSSLVMRESLPEPTI